MAYSPAQNCRKWYWEAREAWGWVKGGEEQALQVLSISDQIQMPIVVLVHCSRGSIGHIRTDSASSAMSVPSMRSTSSTSAAKWDPDKATGENPRGAILCKGAAESGAHPPPLSPSPRVIPNNGVCHPHHPSKCMPPANYIQCPTLGPSRVKGGRAGTTPRANLVPSALALPESKQRTCASCCAVGSRSYNTCGWECFNPQV